MKKSLETVPAVSFLSAHFTTGYPLSVSTRTSSAGMIRLRRTEGLAGVFHLHFDQRKGVQRGKAPLPRAWGCPPILFSISPNPPQADASGGVGARGLKQGCETHPQHQTPTGHQGNRSQAGREVVRQEVNAGQGIEGFRDAKEVALKRQSQTGGHLAWQDAHLFRSSLIAK